MERINRTHEFVFVDATVKDYKSLIRGVHSGIQSIVIHPDEDGIALIADTLSNASDVQHVHIISHGNAGQLQLGSTNLGLEHIKAKLQPLQKWTEAFAKCSELLLYGCNVASGDRGATFVQTLASWLGVSVAAATHPVGHSNLGGNWTLDYQIGSIFAETAIKPSVRANYQGAFTANPLIASADVGQDENGQELFVVDVTTGESVPFGDIGFDTFATSRALDPNSDPSVFPIIYISTDSGTQSIRSFDAIGLTDSPLGDGTTEIPNGTVLKLAQASDSRIFALTGASSTITILDPVTGDVTGSLDVPNLTSGSGDIAFNPENENELFILVTSVPNTFALFTLDITDINSLQFLGNVATDVNNPDTVLTPGAGSGSLAFAPNPAAGGRLDLYLTSNNPNPSIFRIETPSELQGVDFDGGAIPSPDNPDNNVGAILVGETRVSGSGDLVRFSDFATLPIEPEVDIATTGSGPVSLLPGETGTIEFQVTNISPDENLGKASGVIIDTDNIQIPDTLTNVTYEVTDGTEFLVDPTDSTGTGDELEEGFAVNLDVGDSLTVSLTGTVDDTVAVGSTIPVVAGADPVFFFPGLGELSLGLGGTGDINPDNNYVTDIFITSPIVVEKTDNQDQVNAGDSTTYIIDVTNNSETTIEDIRITDVFPAEILNPMFTVTIPPGAGTVDQTSGEGDIDILADLNGGGALTIEVTGEVATSTPNQTILTNTVTVDPPNSPAISDTDTTTVINTNPPEDVDIVVTKTNGRDTIPAGNRTTYTIVVTNDSSIDVGNIQIIDEFPEELLNPRFSITGGTVDERSGTGDLNLLAGLTAGESLTIEVRGRVDESTPDQTVIRNRVTATPLDNEDINPDNNRAADRTTVLNDNCIDGEDIIGTDGDDTLEGTPNNDPMFGLDGNDRLFGRECEDDMSGGRGNDLLRGNEDEDVLEGNQGDDVLNGGGGDDIVNGGTGNDIAEGGSQNDVVNGRRGDDILSGNSGDDLLNGDDGDDILSGDKGMDEANGGEGNDTIKGGSGDDLIAGDNGDDFIRGNRGDDTIQAGQDDDEVFGDSGSDRINGGNGNDSLNGEKGDDILRGRRDRDRIRGGLGDDLADGGADEDNIRTNQGNDRVFGGNSSDIITTNAGNDTINAGLGDDIVEAGQGRDLINGRRGDDDIDAGAGNDVISGFLGNDRIIGGRGNDIADGGDGDDKIRTNQGNDIIAAGNGSDRVKTNGGRDIINAGIGDDVVTAGKGSDIISGRRGDDEIDAGDGDDVIDGFIGNDVIIAGSGRDRISGGDGNDQIEGGRGRDDIKADEGDDTVFGNGGNDTINGGFGADSISGQGGNDKLNGRRGDDEVNGGDGDDIVIGDAGDDRLFGEKGDDTLEGGDNNDFLQAGGGNDVIQSGLDDDTAIGRGGRDLINGGLGDDTLDGGEGRDTLFGRRGSDILSGGDERDRLVGGLGNDTLTGGQRADTFVYEALGTGVDTITDFQVERDLIDLSGIFSQPAFIGGNPLSKVRVRNIGGGSSVVQVDANGNAPGRDFEDLAILEGVRRSSFDNSAFIF